ncbi:hypothetical protein T492DRAFT_913375 [Pavlovales sp. CCMP2436]|nr:hypothetical protein T492DRAFT_913375 [Pavlovales sp. CCMP2436]
MDLRNLEVKEYCPPPDLLDLLEELKIPHHLNKLKELGYDDVDDFENVDIARFETAYTGGGIPPVHIDKLIRAIRKRRFCQPLTMPPLPVAALARTSSDEPGCAFWATDTHTLKRHKRTHSGERPHACDEPGCKYSATQMDTLAKHKRTHSGERPFACDESGCEYRTTTAGQLTAHKRTHSGERPYPCDEPGCEYRSTTASSLTAHKRTHSGERPFARDEPGCEYRSTTASSLTAHKRTHSGERPHACDEPGCKYSATQMDTLTRHKRTHSGERSFACDEPGYGYRATTAGTLNKHTRTHSSERPYACDEPGCGYRATTAGSLTRHKRTHGGERPYACDEPGCAYSATQSGHLKTHKSSQHHKIGTSGCGGAGSGKRPLDEPGAVALAEITRTNPPGPRVKHALMLMVENGDAQFTAMVQACDACCPDASLRTCCKQTPNKLHFTLAEPMLSAQEAANLHLSSSAPELPVHLRLASLVPWPQCLVASVGEATVDAPAAGTTRCGSVQGVRIAIKIMGAGYETARTLAVISKSEAGSEDDNES